MGKVEEVERLVAQLKETAETYKTCRQMIRENAEQRIALMRELCTYVTQRDAGILLGMAESNVSRILLGQNK